jgi:hypothetical protein
MKKILLAVLAAAIAALYLPAQAATATNTFTVGITLNSSCEVVTVPTISFTYTSFQVGDVTPTSNFNIRCTNTKSISSVTLDGTGTYTDVTTGLTYSLSLVGAPTAGNGANQQITVNGLMAGGQAGTCNAAQCTNAAAAANTKTRTITINY